MTIAISILGGLSLITLSLYIIFYIKKNEMIKRVSSTAIFPITGLLCILILMTSLPDSFNIIIYTAIVYLFVTITVILFFHEEKPLARIAERTCFLIAAFTWINLYRTVFYIYRVPLFFILFMVILYVFLNAAVLIVSGKQKLNYYIVAIISISLVSILHFCSFVSLCFGRTLSSVVLFCGTTTNVFLTVRYLIKYSKHDNKQKNLLHFVLLFAAVTLISYSNVILLH